MSIYASLETTIAQLTASHKGILAADESITTIGKRFSTIGLASTPETRRDYRALLLTTPHIEQLISGVILFEETLGQSDQQATPFTTLLRARNIIPGIKVDTGLTTLPFTAEEKITQGLDGLADRLQHYYQAGARFAKWRAVFTVSETLPSTLAIEANATALAHYAALCQTNGLVPIVEPEVLMEGDHELARCAEVSTVVLHTVFKELFSYHVIPEYIILKPNMVLAGQASPTPKPNIEAVAQATLKVLRQTVPAAVPSINFLSGGQTPEIATAHLNAINCQGRQPWRLNFSYGRALQDPVLKTWKGQAINIQAAQEALYHRAHLNVLAAQGKCPMTC